MIKLFATVLVLSCVISSPICRAEADGDVLLGRVWELAGGNKVRLVNDGGRLVVLLPAGDAVYLDEDEYVRQVMRADGHTALALLIGSSKTNYTRIALISLVSIDNEERWSFYKLPIHDLVKQVIKTQYWVEFFTSHTSGKLEGAIHYMEKPGFGKVLRQMFVLNYADDTLQFVGPPIFEWRADFGTSK